MERRQYLTGIGSGIGAMPLMARNGGATDHITVDIVDTTEPLEGGALLDVTAELENTGSSNERVELEFIVGEDEIVAGQRTVPVDAGSTRTVEFLQFRTYPVRVDESFPVRLETESDVAETTVEVDSVDPFDAQYAYPDRDQELTVQPGTKVLFEVDADLMEQQGITHWFVDGEYLITPMGPWPGTYFYDIGRDYFSYTFESAGSYLVDAAVTTDDWNAASRWEVTVTDDGAEPPTVDATRPATSELGTDETTTLELDISSTDTDLDRVVWWMTQSDVILGVSDVDGTSDTARIEIDGGCHTCQIEAWVIDENNVYTTVSPWQFEDYETSNDDDSEEEVSEEDVAVRILETNSPVTGGEMMTVTAELGNTGATDVTREVDLVVGHDPEVLDTHTVTVPADETEQFDLSFETYPVRQDEEFPVRVETGESADERSVYVYGTEA